MNYRLLVLLSGCGMYDGSDPHETILGLYFAQKHGFEATCVAPEGKSLHVMSHVSGQSLSDAESWLLSAGQSFTKSHALNKPIDDRHTGNLQSLELEIIFLHLLVT